MDPAPDVPVDPAATSTTVGPKLPTMRPRDWLILGKVFEGKRASQIAAETFLTVAGVKGIMSTPAFKAAVERVEEKMAERITAGEFGVMAIAKANAIGAIRRVVGLAKGGEDERVRLKANLEILKLSGIQPPTPQVTESPERIIDAMTADELTRFVEDREFPERFKDQFARLATSVVRTAEEARWRPTVEAITHEMVDEPHVTNSRRERPRAAPIEVEEPEENDDSVVDERAG